MGIVPTKTLRPHCEISVWLFLSTGYFKRRYGVQPQKNSAINMEFGELPQQAKQELSDQRKYSCFLHLCTHMHCLPSKYGWRGTDFYRERQRYEPNRQKLSGSRDVHRYQVPEDVLLQGSWCESCRWRESLYQMVNQCTQNCKIAYLHRPFKNSGNTCSEYWRSE